MEMIGVLAASVLPPSQALSFSCRGMALQLEAASSDASGPPRRLNARTHFIVEGLGLSLQQKLWALDSAQGRAVTAKRRVFQYRWRSTAGLPISTSSFAEVPR